MENLTDALLEVVAQTNSEQLSKKITECVVKIIRKK